MRAAYGLLPNTPLSAEGTLATLELLASRLGVRMILSPMDGGLTITLEPVSAVARCASASGLH